MELKLVFVMMISFIINIREEFSMDLYTEAGFRIRLLRELNHYTREQFAEMVEISPKFLYEIENGKKGFSAYTLYKIAQVFCVTTDYILSGKDTIVDVPELQCIWAKFKPDQKGNVERIISIIYELCDNK